MTQTDRTHSLNILLMAVSVVVAFQLPFGLFLFAYAVLGPLHYVTEIRWLHARDFFLSDRRFMWVLFGITVVIALPILSSSIWIFPGVDGQVAGSFMGLISRNTGSLILLCLMLAIGLSVFNNRRRLLIFMVGCVGVILVFRQFGWFGLLTALLLPTLLHVYGFTLMFMTYGVIRSSSRLGWLEVIALLLVPVLIVVWPIDPIKTIPGDYVREVFLESRFQHLSSILPTIFGTEVRQFGDAIFSTEATVRFQVFVAFAYTYHYLNWFSKVSLIGWFRQVKPSGVAGLLAFWILCLFLYGYDYRLGLTALFFLSMLHVILEFPLNVLSTRGVAEFLVRRIRNSGTNM